MMFVAWFAGDGITPKCRTITSYLFDFYIEVLFIRIALRDYPSR